MAVKQFNVPEIGTVYVYKRSGVRNMRLTIRSDGSVRVTIPAWSPYITGVSFARSRADWIQKHALPAPASLMHEQAIGKSHRLYFRASAIATKPASRIKDSQIIVTYPTSLSFQDERVQKIATSASLRALKLQAERLLPQRLELLAQEHGFSYKSVGVKNLKSRWGSCDQNTNITLNLFLMQLPWHLIDYVLLHELTHTRVMRHGPPFWEAMQAIDPRTQSLRKEIKNYKTILQ